MQIIMDVKRPNLKSQHLKKCSLTLASLIIHLVTKLAVAHVTSEVVPAPLIAVICRVVRAFVDV